MADISSNFWHELDSANTDAPPDGWPEGQPANSVNNCARSMMGATKRFYDRINATLTSTGSGNAHVLTYTVAPVSLVKGDVFSFFAGFTNSGATTLNVGVGGAVPVRVGASALSAGSITVGDAITVMYDGTNFQFTGWEPARTTGQNLSVNTLTVTGSGTSVTLSAGSISAAGNITASGNLSGLNLILSSNYVLTSGNTSTSAGPYYSTNTTDSVIRLGPGNGSFFVQTNAGALPHSFSASGNAAHTGTLNVGGLTTISNILNVSSNAAIGGSLSVGTTLSVGSTLTVSGGANVSGDVHGNNLFADGGSIYISAYQVLSSNPINTGYVVLNDNAQRASIFLGSSDSTNYYRQSTHLFQSQAGGVTWLTMASGDFHATQNATFDGTIAASGNITSSSYVNALDIVFTHGTGVVYQNIGPYGFNFRWDGSHIFGRVDNIVEYPLYNSNGGLINGVVSIQGTSNADSLIVYKSGGGSFFTLKPETSAGTGQFGYWTGASFGTLALQGAVTVTGAITGASLSVSGTVTATTAVNTTTFQTNGNTLATQDGTYNLLYRLDGSPGIYLGNNGNSYFRNTQLIFDNGGTTFATMAASLVNVFVPFVMNNNIAILAKESGGAQRSMLLLNASNNLVIGNTTTSLVDIDSGGNVTVTAVGNFIVSNNSAQKPGGGPWDAISDARVKEDIRDYEVGLEALRLRPVTYKLNGKGGTVADGREFVGLVADEVEPIMPEMVGRLDDDELGEVKTLNTNALTYALLNVCKKLEARLAALEAK